MKQKTKQEMYVLGDEVWKEIESQCVEDRAGMKYMGSEVALKEEVKQE